MIERISGKLLNSSPTFCIIDCHGLGVGLHISLNTFQYLERRAEAETISLLTHLHVREDALQLFGFAEAAEKEMFALLISISGVGPRLAMAVLSGSSSEDLRGAIAREDVGMLTRIPGVGKKTAQRIVLELREKIQKHAGIAATSGVVLSAGGRRGKTQEAVMALVALDYKEADARRGVEKALAAAGSDIPLEDLIILALKEI